MEHGRLWRLNERLNTSGSLKASTFADSGAVAVAQHSAQSVGESLELNPVLKIEMIRPKQGGVGESV